MTVRLHDAFYWDCPGCRHRNWTPGVPVRESTTGTQDALNADRDTIRRVVEQSAIVDGLTADAARRIGDELDASADGWPCYRPAEVTCVSCLESYGVRDD